MRWWLALGLAGPLALGCGGANQRDGFTLSAAAGLYSDGSGALGLAAMARVVDRAGALPTEPWQGRIRGINGPLVPSLSYDATAGHAWTAWWWPDVPANGGDSDVLELSEAGNTNVLALPFVVPALTPLAPAHPNLTGGGTTLAWDAVAGAAEYRCTVTSNADGTTVLDASTATPGCDVSALPDGAYAASVLSFSTALSDPAGPKDPPTGFLVSEGHVFFAKSANASPAVQVRVAGGALDYGGAARGLAVFLSIAALDGTPTASDWTVDVTGPSIPASQPLEFTYSATSPRLLRWSYDLEPTQGRYSVLLSSGDQHLTAVFTVADRAPLPTAQNIVASPSSSGAASVSFDAVPGARSYFVSVWSSASGQEVGGQWVDSNAASFGANTFTSGDRYDVYVTAADVDLLGPSTPDAVSVSENTYLPSHFVAP